jgi:protein-S-isoprenylcysteine O-methyltransferase Ste14
LFLGIAFPVYLGSFLAILGVLRLRGQDPRGAGQGSRLLEYAVGAATVSWQVTMILSIFDVGAVTRFGRIDSLDSLGVQLAGSLLFAAGLVLAVCGALTLRDSFRLGLPEKRTLLITTGVYRHSRNPVIAGLYAYVFGSFLLVPSVPVLACVLANLIAYHWKILSEERALRELHGGVYEAYCARVGRYYPGVRTARAAVA